MIRHATPNDLPAIVDIYNEVIVNSTAIYSDQLTTLEERQYWFATLQERHYPILVAVWQQQVIGFASFDDFKNKPGFRFTVEHSVHLAPQHRGRGIGTALMQALINIATKSGKHIMVAGIDAANTGSIRMHQQLGFIEVARMPQVGFKFDRWQDLVLLQRLIDAMPIDDPQLLVSSD